MLKNLAKIGLVIGIFSLLLSIVIDISVNAPQRMADYIYSSNINNVVMVKGLNGAQGTGVITTTRRGVSVVLTNKHVCFGVGPNVILENSEFRVEAHALYVDAAADLCLITVPAAQVRAGTLVSLATTRDNQEFYTLGYPLWFNKTLLYGRIISAVRVKVGSPNIGQPCAIVQDDQCLTDENLITTTVLQFPGSSGSPAININNQIIGLMSRRDPETGFGVMVPLNDIQRVLNKF